ncbi:hypothetical protein CCP3SC1_140014 [Gammaproteobacteria bacterium]
MMTPFDAFRRVLAELHIHPIERSPVMLHGYLTGWALAPTNGDTDYPFLQNLLGLPDDAEFALLPTTLERVVVECLETFHDALRKGKFSPELYSSTGGRCQTEVWCQGFAEAVAVAEDAWEILTLENTALTQQLVTLQLLSDSDLYAQLMKRSKSTHTDFVREMTEVLPALIDVIAGHVYTGGSDAHEVKLPQFDPEELAALDEPDLMEILVTLEDRVPRVVIDTCVARGAEFLPWLRTHLEGERHWSTEQATPAEFWGLLHSVMILGLMDSPQAAELLLEVFARMTRQPEHDLWAWLGNHWAALFHNKRVGVEPFVSIAWGKHIAALARGEAMACMVAAVAVGPSQQLEKLLDQLATIAADPMEENILRVRVADLLLFFPRERYRDLLLALARLQMEDSALVYVAFDEDDVATVFQEGDTPFWDSDPWSFYDPDEITIRQLSNNDAANEGDAW